MSTNTSILLLSLIFTISCEQQPTNLQRSVVGAAQGTNVPSTPQNPDSSDASGEPTTSPDPSEDGDGEDEIVIPRFANFEAFDVQASKYCGSCHSPESSYQYKVGSVESAYENAIPIMNRIRGIGNIMPPSEPRLDNIQIQSWSIFLNNLSIGDGGGDDTGPLTFAQFNEQANNLCKDCHAPGSGRLYVLDDENSAETYATEIFFAINGVGKDPAMLPPTLSEEIILSWDSYLMPHRAQQLDFASFDMIASVKCASCHTPESSFQYKTGDENLVQMNAQAVSEHIKGVERTLMPPAPATPISGPMVDLMDTYLNIFIPMNFVEFDAQAREYCLPCHASNSSYAYRVGDQGRFEAYAGLIKDRITLDNSTPGAMPPSAMLPEPIMGRWVVTLDQEIQLPMSFETFNAEAELLRGSCHGESSARTYKVGDQMNLMQNAAMVKDRITRLEGDAEIMPTSGPLLPSNIERWNTYLDQIIPAP